MFWATSGRCWAGEVGLEGFLSALVNSSEEIQNPKCRVKVIPTAGCAELCLSSPPHTPLFCRQLCVLKDRPSLASDSWTARRVGARGERKAPPLASISLPPNRDHGLSHRDFFNDEILLSLLVAGPNCKGIQS